MKGFELFETILAFIRYMILVEYIEFSNSKMDPADHTCLLDQKSTLYRGKQKLKVSFSKTTFLKVKG